MPGGLCTVRQAGGGKIVCIVSGGNIDLHKLCHIWPAIIGRENMIPSLTLDETAQRANNSAIVSSRRRCTNGKLRCARKCSVRRLAYSSNSNCCSAPERSARGAL